MAMDMEEMYYPLSLKIVIGVLCIPVFIGGIVGNLLVIRMVIKERHMKRPTYVFITLLAVSDLIILFFCMPFTVPSVYFKEDWIFGTAMCKTVMFMQVFSVLLSVLTLTAMNIERYLLIVYPLRMRARWTISSCLKVCFCIVVFAFIISLPRPWLGGMLDLKEGMPWGPKIYYPVHGSENSSWINGITSNETSTNSTNYYNKPILFCFEDLGPEPRHKFVTIYNSLRITMFFVLPVVLNGYICWAIKRALRESADTRGDSTQQIKQSEHKKLMRLLRWMMVVFAVCWFPYQFFLAIQALDDRELFAQKWNQMGMIVVSIFLYFHCISGPILYYNLNSNFRKGFIYYLCCCCGVRHAPGLSRQGTATSTTSTTSMMNSIRSRLSRVFSSDSDSNQADPHSNPFPPSTPRNGVVYSPVQKCDIEARNEMELKLDRNSAVASGENVMSTIGGDIMTTNGGSRQSVEMV